MNPERQEAYRHLLYAVLVSMRAGERSVAWWNPFSWRRAVREWRLHKDIAGAFHNLAFFSAHNFERFDDARFWRDIDWLGKTHSSEFVERYRGIFEDYLSGKSARTC